MKKFYFIVIFFLLAAVGYAQKGIVSGKVLDAEDKLPLPGALVQIPEQNKYTISDSNGDYEFLNVTEGSFEVQVKYMGYSFASQKVEIVSGGNTVANFNLKASGTELDEVIVGNRLKGQAKALNQQKNNENITNVLSSDQMGRYPDANIGDAIKRVPGIAMQNDQGEARNIIIRGLGPSLNSVTINGDRIPSADGDNRNVQLDVIPADMIGSVEVNKTLTPDMDADAIGGSVDLITRATPNGQRISATIAGGYMPIREQGIYTGAFVYGNRFVENKLGLVLSGSYNNVNYGSDNIEDVWVVDDFGNQYVNESDIREYNIQRIRQSAAVSLDYKINNNNTIFANGMFNLRNDRENRFRTTYDDIEPIYDGETITGFEGRVTRQTKGGIDNNQNKNTRLEEQIIQNYSLRGEHLLSPELEMDWAVNYSNASEYKPNERYISYRQEGVEMSENLSNTYYPLVTTTGESLDEFELESLTQNTNDTFENEIGAKLNFRFPFTVIPSQKGRIRTGLRTRLLEKTRNNVFYSYEPINDNMATLADIPTVYYNGVGFNPGSQYVPGNFATAAFLGGLDLNNTDLFEQETDPSEYLAENYNAKEQIYAAYVRWDQDFNDKLSMIFGVRVENTHNNYKGNRVVDEETLDGVIEESNDYTNVLPNLTLKYNASKSLVLRAAITTALARPSYYDLAPYVNIVSEDIEISAGNPNLKATYSFNYDFMVEKYYEPIGLLSGGAFYKNLDDFIYNYSSLTYTSGDFENDFPGQVNPIPVGEEWNFVQPRNGDNVDVYGFEVAFQRQMDFFTNKFLKGFGVNINYTFTQSNAKGIADEDGNEREGVSLPGTTPHMFNGSLFWENKRFSARASVNYTSYYLDALGAEEYEDSYYGEQLFLDANASYKITPQLTVFVEAKNLTNQPLRYFQYDKALTQQAEYYEAAYNLGLKYDF